MLTGCSTGGGGGEAGGRPAHDRLDLPRCHHVRPLGDAGPPRAFEGLGRGARPGTRDHRQHRVHRRQEMIQQAESAITRARRSSCINPITADGSLPVVDAAKRDNIPVISYEGLIADADLAGYITFDNTKVGELQGAVHRGPRRPRVDDRHHERRAGLRRLHRLQGGVRAPGASTRCVDSCEHHDRLRGRHTLDWLAENAQSQTEQALTDLNDNVSGISPRTTASRHGGDRGAEVAQLNGKVVVTGQDATIPGLQEILLGNQTMTVYKDLKQQAAAAAEAAVKLARGEGRQPHGHVRQRRALQLASLFLDPEVIDLSQHQEASSTTGFVDREDQLCTGRSRGEVRLLTQRPVQRMGRASKPGPRLRMRGIRKSFGNVEALRGVDLDVAAGRDHGARRRQRRRQVDPDQDARRRARRRRGRGRDRRRAGRDPRNPQDAVRRGIETVYQDLALCDNLDVVANLYLGRELRAAGLRSLRQVPRSASGWARGAAASWTSSPSRLPSLTQAVGSLSGGQRQADRRRARRAAGVAHRRARRAHRRARRAADRHGLPPHPNASRPRHLG